MPEKKLTTQWFFSGCPDDFKSDYGSYDNPDGIPVMCVMGLSRYFCLPLDKSKLAVRFRFHKRPTKHTVTVQKIRRSKPFQGYELDVKTEDGLETEIVYSTFARILLRYANKRGVVHFSVEYK